MLEMNPKKILWETTFLNVRNFLPLQKVTNIFLMFEKWEEVILCKWQMLPEKVNKQISQPSVTLGKDKVQYSANDILKQESQLKTCLSV